MITPLFFGKVEGGRIVYNEQDDFDTYIAAKLEGKEVEIRVRAKIKNRTPKENRYYWGVVVKLLSDEFGEYPEVIHYSKDFLGGLRLVGKTTKSGKAYEGVEDTHDMSTARFEEYQALCRTWASTEHGIYIPLPNEVSY